MLELRRVFAGYKGHVVLREVSFRVPAGRVTALVGPNAAGKTTVVRALMGWIPVQGHILWQGQEITTLKPRQRARLLAVVPQEGELPPHFTVEQTVLLGRTPHLSWWGVPRQSDIQVTRAALEALNLTHLAAQPLAALSGGERQRVLIARALAQDTPILILDEPTVHLDWRVQLEVLELARARAATGVAVLMVLHDLNIAARFADQVVLLHQGRVHAVGAPQFVLTPERVAQVYGVDVTVLPHDGRPFLIPRSSLRTRG